MLIIALAVLALSASPAVAQQTQDAKAEAVKEKKICRSDTGTGSIMSKKTCHTKAEWEQLAQAAAKDMDRTRDDDQARQQIGAAYGN